MKIKSIKKGERKLTVDIEVNDTHSYQLKNGSIVHNTSSLVLESASGAHPHHARKYFRRIQCNKLDNVYNFMKKNNPHLCEESVWSANGTDDVITFPIEIPEKSIIKDDLTAIKHLSYIKSIQENWVN